MLRRTLRPARGLSLVELLVGIAVGMFVVASAAMLVSTQLNDNRKLLLETQVQQDLRAAADIITRELRRARHWPDAANFVPAAGAAASAPNPYATVKLNASPLAEVRFEYWRANNEHGPFGFKQDGAVLKTLLSAGGWQELTDGNTLRITAFRVTPLDSPLSFTQPCPKPCSDGTASCWPTLTLAAREFQVDIEGEAVSDPSVKRSLSTVVRLRNDLMDVIGACPV